MKIFSRQQQISGFTFMEMLIVIVFMSLLAGVASLLVSQGYNAYIANKTAASTANKSVVALDNVLRELKSAEGITALASNTVTFVNQQGQSIVIALSGTNLTRSVNGGGAQVICNNVSVFSLGYFDLALATTSTPTDVDFVTVSLTINDGSVLYPLIGATTLRKNL